MLVEKTVARIIPGAATWVGFKDNPGAVISARKAT